MPDLYDFWIGTSTTKIGLEGVSLAAPVKAAQHRPGYGQSDTVEDLITVLLEDKDVDPTGSSGIVALLGKFEQIFNQARLFQQARLSDEILLHLEPVQNEIWESRVINGWVEVSPLPGASVPSSGYAPGHRVAGPTEQRLNGSLALLLHVIRLNFWQMPEIQLPTSGIAGTDLLAGTTLVNHYAASTSSNFVDIHLESLAPAFTGSMDLPLPLRLEIANTSGVNQGTFFVGHNYLSSIANNAYCLEDATCTGGASHADANASGGSYKDFSWSGTAWGNFATWTQTAAVLAACKSNFFKFVMRLGEDLPDTDMEMKIRIVQHATSNILGETAPITCTPGQRLQEFGMLRLPPFVLRDPANASSLDIQLWARQLSGVNHYFHMDYIQMLPSNGFRKYEAVSPLYNTWKIEDDASKDVVTTLEAAGNELVSHSAKGPAFYLKPGVVNTLIFNWMRSDGSSVISDTLKVKAYCRPRRRIV